MIKKMMFGLVLVVLGVAVAAVGDVVVLQSGDRVEGEIVSETPTEVLIKRAYKTGGIKYTQKIERSNILRVEKGEVESPAEASAPAAAQSKPSSSQPAQLTDEEKKELLKTALAHWEKQEYSGAGVVLSRLVNSCGKIELNRMSKEVEGSIQLSLADMTAEAHLQAAIARAKGQGVVLSYVTEYEKPSLVPRLIDAYEEAIKKPVSAEPAVAKPVVKPVAKSKTKAAVHGKAAEPPPPPQPETPPASQPAGKTFVLASLMEKPGSFDGTPEERAAVGRQIRFASSLLLARIRYDSECKTSQEVKADVEAKKKQLAALQKELFSKATEPTTGKEPKGRLMNAGQREKPGAGPEGRGAANEDQQEEKGVKSFQKDVRKLKRDNRAQEGGPGMEEEKEKENENPNQ